MALFTSPSLVKQGLSCSLNSSRNHCCFSALDQLVFVVFSASSGSPESTAPTNLASSGSKVGCPPSFGVITLIRHGHSACSSGAQVRMKLPYLIPFSKVTSLPNVFMTPPHRVPLDSQVTRDPNQGCKSELCMKLSQPVNTPSPLGIVFFSTSATLSCTNFSESGGITTFSFK